MSRSCQSVLCSEPQSLVLIEVLPLCQAGPLDALAVEATLLEAFSSRPRSYCASATGVSSGLPARSIAIMPCLEALALVEGVGDVVL